MTWRLAGSLVQLRVEINQAFPGRDKTSDGGVADDRHGTSSDHSPKNPNHPGVVTAVDVDENAADGTETVGDLFHRLRQLKDPRAKYGIYEGEMWSKYPVRGYPAWTLRPYTGSNPHPGHFHLSVDDDPALYDDTRPWGLFEEEDVDYDKLRGIVADEVGKAVKAAHDAAAARDTHWVRLFPILDRIAKKVGA